MSLTTCPKCGTVVTKRANVCHNCGQPLDQKESSSWGKKSIDDYLPSLRVSLFILFGLIVLILLLVLLGL